MGLLEDAGLEAPKVDEPEEEAPPPSGGDLPSGPSIERYRRATVKQVVLIFDGIKHREFVERLARIMKTTGARNHTEALIAAVDEWEQVHVPRAERTTK